MWKLLRYMKKYRKESIIAPLFKLLEATLELLVPLVVAAIIDKGIANDDKSILVRMTLLMVAFGILGLVCSVIAQYFAAKSAVRFSADVRHALFAHIESLSFQELDRLGVSTLITRMTSDMNQVQNGVNLTLRLLLRSPFVVFGAMLMAFTIDVKAALLFVVLIPVLSLVIFGIMLLSIPLFRRVQAKLDSLLSITRQNLSGIRVLRAFCREEGERKEFDARNEGLTQNQKLAGRISALMNPLTYILVNAGIILLIRTGALRVEAGLLTQGAVVALYNYMSQILVELIKLANLIINITKSIACGNRVQAVFEVTSSLPLAAFAGDEAFLTKTTSAPFIEYDHVSLKYEGAAENMLEDINLQANSGETVGIIGGTGAGKSSLVWLLPRFYDANEGSVRLNGTNVKDFELSALRSRIGIVPQSAVLFSGTIRSNLTYRKHDASDTELWECLRIAQAEGFVKKLPDQLDAKVSQGGKNFSGGQRQRLTIARALVGSPELLILDDSSSALDYATDLALRKSLYHLNPKPVIFLISQRTSSLMHADKICVLEDGRMVGYGTHEELLKTCATYQEIYASQFKKEVAAV